MNAYGGTETSGRGEGARTRLLEAAIGTIQERGRGGATAREIAAAAEANLASIVYYFGSKDALIDQALVVASERWTASVKATGLASGDGKTLGERMGSSLGTFIASLARNRPLALAFLEALASADRSPAVRSALADCYEGLREAVGQGTGNGAEQLGMGEEAAEAAGAVVALFDGLLIQWLLDPDRDLDPLSLVASLGSLMGTALTEAGNLRDQGSSLASEAVGLAEKADGAQERAGERSRRGTASRRRVRSARGAVYRLKSPRGSDKRTVAREVVLLQTGELRNPPTVIIAPTSRRVAPGRFRPEIELDGTATRVLLDRLRAVDRERLLERVGRLSAREQRAVDEAMAAVLGLA